LAREVAAGTRGLGHVLGSGRAAAKNEKKAPAMSIHAAAIRTAPPPSPNRRLPLFPVAAAAVAMLLAAGALAGYALDIEFLRRIGTLGAAVNPLAATALLLAALVVFPLETRAAQLWQLGASGVLATVSLVVLADHAMGGGISVSNWLFAGTVAADLAEGKRNVFGASAALCLVALAAAQVLRMRGLIQAAQIVALGLCLPPLIGIIGLVYGRTALTGAMPVQVALAIVALAAALLGRDPRMGIVSVIVNRRTSGMLARVVLPAAVATPFLLDWIFLAAQRWGVLPFETSLSLSLGTAMAVSGGLLIYTLSEIDRIDRRRRRAEWRLSFEADHDPLTGALNRKSFFAAIDAAIGARNSVILLYLDFDGFKGVNEKLGQAAGDDVLRYAVQRLLGVLRPSDLVARLGGDEFGILIPGNGARLAREIGERAQNALARPFAIDMERALIGCSVGAITCDPTLHETTSAELVKQAEEALAAAKRAGANRIEVRALAG
jgi:diguanylate cyclase (GGDEF)-like protein